VKACHDSSEGGIGVALAEMAFAGGFGAETFLTEAPHKVKTNDVILFSESNTRFIVEIKKKDKKRFESTMKGIPIGLIGCTSDKKNLKIHGLDSKKIVDVDIDILKEAWQRPLRW